MKIIALLLSLFLVACGSNVTNSNLADSGVGGSSEAISDSELLLNSLLNMGLSSFSYQDESGNRYYDELAHFQALEQLYIRNSKPSKGRSTLNEQQLKTVLFVSFYASQKNSGALQSYLATDLTPIFEKQSDEFLGVLTANPYLIEPVCERMNRYFGFEGMNTEQKAPFLKTHTALIKKVLGQENSRLCLSKFDA